MKPIERYFREIEQKVKLAYNVAEKAKKQGRDPEPTVSIPSARNMAERVEGLISAVAPQIIGSGIPRRIQELEKKYGALDWRIALTISEEISEEKVCKFSSTLEAAEV